MPPAPLTLAELSTRMDRIGGFERHPVIAVAVSGGPDSMALTLLADRWARGRGGSVRALTVDHGLRPESGAEAGQVAAWLGARGIQHETLVWAGDKPKAGIQEAARTARYRLLAEWCAAHGVLHLMVAHQREDQAETHLIRHRAGSGVDGLAAMSAVRELAGCRLLRPLLDVPRVRLACFLAVEHQPFLEDPSNRNPAFERSRLRAATARTIDAAIAATRCAATARIERERELDALLARAVSVHPAGFAAIDTGALEAATDELRDRLLARVAACVGALRYPPRRDRVARMRQALTGGTRRTRTLGGCSFVFWRGRILVLRELAAGAAPVRLKPGADTWWDRRFIACIPASAGPVTLAYLGLPPFITPANAGSQGSRSSVGSLDSGWRGNEVGKAAALPRLLYPVLPAAWDETGEIEVPHLGPDGAAKVRLAFRPANPLTDAGFTVV